LFLYYITDRRQFPGDEAQRETSLLRKIAEAARCGIDFIQLREKDIPVRRIEMLAHAAVRAIQENSSPNSPGPGTRLLLNSRTDVAIACGAGGVHLPSGDIAPAEIREIWERSGSERPTSCVISVACHAVGDVVKARSNGADFALFAPVFEKNGVADVRAAGLGKLREACLQEVPVIALGGVTVGNACRCVDAGVAGIAGIRIFQENDIASVVRQLRGE
jgi:thiamine-phosphate pyrophosphorylase